MALLFLLLLPILAVSGRLNACGSNVSAYDNYLDISVDVPIELVANMIVGNMKPNPFKDLHDPEYYRRYVEPYIKMTRDENIGNWTMSDGIRTRIISQRVENEHPLKIDEIQSINDELKLVEVVSTITPVEPIVYGTGYIGQPVQIIDFEIVTHTCLSSSTRYQVDMRLTVPENTRKTTHNKMRMVNTALGKALKKLELVQQKYQYDFKFNSHGYIRQKSTNGDTVLA